MTVLPTPQGRQLDALYLPSSGHTVVLGTAGSGKTLMAMLRARYLSDPSTDHGGPTLLVTFNNALVAYLRAMLPKGPGSLQPETFHRFTRGYLASQGHMRNNDILTPSARDRLVASAIASVRTVNDGSPFDRPVRWFVDEFDWISGNGLYDRAVYVDPTQTERRGRKLPLRADQRSRVFDVFDAYRASRASRNVRYDWADVASAALVRLRSDSAARRYRHIVIDEGQDFSPEMLRVLVAAADPAGSITFFGDYAQQIYGQRYSWRSVGLNVPKVIEFVDNYRNSLEIAQLAIAISKMEYFADEPDLVVPQSPAASGPKPAVVRCRSRAHEADFVAGRAVRLSRNASVAILLRDRGEDEHMISQRLPSTAVRLHKEMKTWVSGAGIWYGTYHAAKGLEFDHVLMPFCSNDRLPDPEVVNAFGEDEALAREGRLLYVGVTRARALLIMTYSGHRTRLLPRGTDVYDRMVAK